MTRDVVPGRADDPRAGTREIAAEHGDDAVWAAVSHGDPIKAILADALGLHLDSFQRIMVDPASLSVIRYTATRPYVVTTNSTNADLATLLTPPPKKRDRGHGLRGRRRGGRRPRGRRARAEPGRHRSRGPAASPDGPDRPSAH